MSLAQLAVLSRKIHRILVIFITILGTIMAISGLTMHEAEEGNELFSFINLNFAREIHNSLSTYFAIILGLMILTGLYLYLFPYFTKLFKKPLQ